MRRIVLLVALFASTARAGGAPDRLGYEPLRDGSVTAVAAGWLLVSEVLLKPSLAPDVCRWCASNALDQGLADAARWDDTHLAARLSDIGLYGFMPLATLAALGGIAHSEDRLGTWGWDAALLLEAVSVSLATNQLVKFGVARERPFVHRLDGAAKTAGDNVPDNNVSFWSGHTSFSFALVVAAATITEMRGSQLWKPLLGVGLPLAAFVGYLRMGADKHYFTDVFTGAVMGSLFGYFIPKLHAAKADDGGGSMVQPLIGPQSVGVAVAW